MAVRELRSWGADANSCAASRTKFFSSLLGWMVGMLYIRRDGPPCRGGWLSLIALATMTIILTKTGKNMKSVTAWVLL